MARLTLSGGRRTVGDDEVGVDRLTVLWIRLMMQGRPIRSASSFVVADGAKMAGYKTTQIAERLWALRIAKGISQSILRDRLELAATLSTVGR
jgi:hypothetical protein